MPGQPGSDNKAGQSQGYDIENRTQGKPGCIESIQHLKNWVESNQMTAESIKATNKPTKPRVDKSKALSLKLNNNLSYRQIADMQGVTPQAIHSAIKDLLPVPETKTYKENRADILAHIQLKLLSQLDDDRLKRMPAASAVLAACQLYDKERLERGMSSENIQLIHADIAKIKGQVKQE